MTLLDPNHDKWRKEGGGDWRRNYGFKAPKRSRRYRNLYFTGGSVNPGRGMPMVFLCGQKVCDQCIQQEQTER